MRRLSVWTIGFLATVGVIADGRPEISICESTETQSVEDPILTRCQASRALVARLTHDDAVVLKNFDALQIEIDKAFRKQKVLKADEVRLIYDAIDFAAEKHRLQMRKNKEKTPYISHPLGVAHYVIQFGEIQDTASIIGALLHDTVEDTQTTYEEIEQRFGAQVASYVREVSDNKKLDFAERKRQQLIDAPKKTKGAAQIQLADKLSNLQDLLYKTPEGWSRIRIERYYQWAQSVVDRLPPGNEALKSEIYSVINTYWEQQKK